MAQGGGDDPVIAAHAFGVDGHVHGGGDVEKGIAGGGGHAAGGHSSYILNLPADGIDETAAAGRTSHQAHRGCINLDILHLTANRIFERDVGIRWLTWLFKFA